MLKSRTNFIYCDLMGCVESDVLKKDIKNLKTQINLLPENAIIYIEFCSGYKNISLLLAAFNTSHSFIVGRNILESGKKKLFKKYHISHYLRWNGDELDIININSADIQSGNPKFVGVLTSGTAGLPKIVEHTKKSLIHDLHLKPYPNGVWFCAYPLTHYAGLQVFFKAYLSKGTFIQNVENSIKDDIRLIVKHKCTFMNCTPSYFRKLLLSIDEEMLSKLELKVITLGGEGCEQALLDKIQSVLPKVRIVQVYASTESGPVFFVKDNYEGIPLFMFKKSKATISDEGELLLPRQKSSMTSYLHEKQYENYIKTGDLVEIKNNRLYFVGRKDDVINVGGSKVNLLQVESVLQSMDGILDVIVYGVKNPILTNLVKAEVILDDSFNGEKSEKLIKNYCKQFLPDYAVPQLVEFVKEIPLTSMHKKKRGAGHG